MDKINNVNLCKQILILYSNIQFSIASLNVVNMKYRQLSKQPTTPGLPYVPFNLSISWFFLSTTVSNSSFSASSCEFRFDTLVWNQQNTFSWLSIVVQNDNAI